MRVRDAHWEDAGAIARVGRASWWATYSPLLGPELVSDVVATRYVPGTVRGWIEEARRRPEHELLVAEDCGRVAGFLHLVSSPELPHHVQRLYVHPDTQRRGLGRALVHELEARLAPGTRWALDVAAQNRGALAFYASLGLEEVGRRPAPWEVLMAKRVPPRAPGPR